MKYVLILLMLALVACSDDNNPVDPGASSGTLSSGTTLSSGASSGVIPGSSSSSSEDPWVPPQSSSSAPEVLGQFNLIFVDSSNGSQYLSGVIDAPTEVTNITAVVQKDGSPFSAVRIRFMTTLLAWKQANPGGDLSRVPLTGANSLNATIDLFDNGCDGSYEFIVTATAGAWTASDTAGYELTRWADCP